MRPKRWTFTLAAADDNGMLDDATGAGPWATILGAPADGCGHLLILTCTGDLSLITFTITGTDPEGRTITEAIVGSSSSTTTGAKFFATVTSVVASATAGANTFDLGWTAVAVTPIVPVDHRASVGPMFGVDIGGTVNFDGQGTNGPIWDTANASLYFAAIAGMSGATADAIAALSAGTTGVRVKVNSHTTGTLAVTVSQGH